jgi:hypothetical protein
MDRADVAVILRSPQAAVLLDLESYHLKIRNSREALAAELGGTIPQPSIKKESPTRLVREKWRDRAVVTQ